MEFLDQIILDNTIRSYLIVFGTIFIILILRKFISRKIASLLCSLIRRAGGTIEKKSFIALIVKPLSWFIVVLVSVFTIDKLDFPEAWRYSVYGVSLQTVLEKTGVILIIISFFRCLLRIIDFIAIILNEKAGATKTKGDDQLIIFIRDFLKVVVTLAAILFLIKVGFNQNVGTLLTGLSIVGAALALAAKESLENLIASFIIFFDKPFYVGDFVKVNNVTGRVERIGLRSTRIRTADKTLVTVPNKQMVDSIVDNWSMRSHHRTELKLEMAGTTSTDVIRSFIKEVKNILAKNSMVIESNVHFSEFIKNAVIITIEYLSVSSPLDKLTNLRAEMNMEFKKALENHKVDQPPPVAEVKVEPPGPEPPKQQPLI